MVSQLVTVPYFKNTLKEIEKILLSRGLIRWALIKGNNLETSGEAGIGFFYITLEDETTIKIDAKNRQAIEIISNLIVVELNDLKEKQPEDLIDKNKSKIDYVCVNCHVPLEFLGKKKWDDDLKMRILSCPQCKKLEFYLDN